MSWCGIVAAPYWGGVVARFLLSRSPTPTLRGNFTGETGVRENMMNEKSRAITRTVLTDFCRDLGYDPSDVISIHAESQTIAVTTHPRGISGIEGITTVHEIADAEVRS